MQMPALKISIVLCTRNRVATLIPTLDGLRLAAAQLSQDQVELIVVDNGSTDDTAEVVKSWAETAGLVTQLIYEPKAGLAIARNSGVRAASGNIIVFTDDDCCVESDYLERLLNLYSSTPGPRIIGGRVQLGDASDLPVTIKDDQHAAEFNGIGAGGFLLGCNMTMTRSAWEKIGEMDERFGAGTQYRSAEDTDYIYRAYVKGVPVSYVPELSVSHFHGRRTQAEVGRLFEGYNIGNGALYAKYFGTPFMRQLRWDIQNAVLEMFGIASFKPELGLTYRSMVAANLSGMMMYCRNKLIGGGTSR